MTGQEATTSTTTGGRHTPLVVALYGRSLLLAGVGRRLARREDLRVVSLDAPTAEAGLGPSAPDVLLVDLADVPMESALALLRDRPELLLVGLEASGARLLVLSGERAGSVGTDELVALIEGGRSAARTDWPIDRGESGR